MRVLSIAGLDPTAGAGVTADVRVVQALGGEAASVATCLTVQNRYGLQRVERVPAAWLRDALNAVAEDQPIGAIKIGMLPDVATLEIVAAFVEQFGAVPSVVDPVLSATAGGFVPETALPAALRELLLPRVTLTTPNVGECEALGGVDALRASCAVLVTDGDSDGVQVVDRLYEKDGAPIDIAHPRIRRRSPVHGTGCALSTAVAFYLAGHAPLEIACRAATEDLRRFIAATPEDEIEGLPVGLRITSAR